MEGLGSYEATPNLDVKSRGPNYTTTLGSCTRIISIFLLNPISSRVCYTSCLFPILCYIKETSPLALETIEISSSSYIDPSGFTLINILV